MTIDEKLNRLIELVEKMHEYNRHGARPSSKQINDLGRELYALKQETPWVWFRRQRYDTD